jgi:hypothetical protein
MVRGGMGNIGLQDDLKMVEITSYNKESSRYKQDCVKSQFFDCDYKS